MSCRKVAQLDEPLRALWRRRPDLTHAEWTELYRLVVYVLSVQDRSRFDGLPGGPEEYIQDYFVDKVFLGGRPGGEIYHTCALVAFFDRYLNSRRRDPAIRNKGYGAGGNDRDDASPDLVEIQTAKESVWEFLHGEQDPAHLGKVLDLLEITLGKRLAGVQTSVDGADLFELIEDYLGISVAKVLPSARSFLDATGDWSRLSDHSWWIRAYLQEHFCPQDGLALNALARRYQVPSYHYKALKLGVTVPKGAEAAQREFAASYLGQWLVSLDIPADDEHRAEIAVALKILCVVALNGQDSGALAARSSTPC